jgi:hypothetical protein
VYLLVEAMYANTVIMSGCDRVVDAP